MESFYNVQTYYDFDQFSDSITWDLELTQLSAGKFRADIVSFGDRDIQIGETVYNRTLLQHGSVPHGFTFAIHHPDSAPFTWRHLDFTANSIIVFPENNEHQGLSQPNHHPFTITVTETFLSAVSNDIGLPELSRFVPKGEVLLCDPTFIRRLQALLRSLCSTTKSLGEKFFDSLLSYETKREIARLLLLAIAASKKIKLKKRQFYRRKKVADRILGYLDADLATAPSLSELCKVGGVDERTLRNIFYEQFSLSPNKFLKCYRLNSARSELKRANHSEKSIADIANENGFWHMGQFANDYNKLFGELPSATLKKIA
jgi:AraC-like DNA-binding protein